MEVNLEAIDIRLQYLRNCIQSSSYSKQKSSLRIEFESFPSSLPNVKTLHFATPTDVLRFLEWKDRNGKTVLHVNGCPMPISRVPLNVFAPDVCRSKPKTVDSYMGKFHSIFKELG